MFYCIKDNDVFMHIEVLFAHVDGMGTCVMRIPMSPELANDIALLIADLVFGYEDETSEITGLYVSSSEPSLDFVIDTDVGDGDDELMRVGYSGHCVEIEIPEEDDKLDELSVYQRHVLPALQSSAQGDGIAVEYTLADPHLVYAYHCGARYGVQAGDSGLGRYVDDFWVRAVMS